MNASLWYEWAVYPRVCGGTGLADALIDDAEGLSPRVRGNPIPSEPDLPIGGSIPACAGEPRRRRLRTAPTSVYPRVCGGTQALG